MYPPAMQEMQAMQVGPLGWKDALENGMANHSSILVWRIPWTEEPGGLHSIALQGVRQDLSESAHTHTHVVIDTYINIAILLDIYHSYEIIQWGGLLVKPHTSNQEIKNSI